MLKLIIIIILLFIVYGFYRYSHHKRLDIRKRRNEILRRLRDKE